MLKGEAFDPQDSKEKQSQKTEKKNAAAEKVDKHQLAYKVTESYRDLIKNTKAGLYSYKGDNGAVFDVTIQGNNLVLHKFHKGNTTELFKAELNKEALTITLEGKGTGRFNRIEKTYSGTVDGLNAAQKKIYECQQYIKKSIEQKNTSKKLSALDKELDEIYT